MYGSLACRARALRLQRKAANRRDRKSEEGRADHRDRERQRREKKIDRGLIDAALTLDFIRDGRNFILIGSNGLGKTLIAKNIAHQAVLAAVSVVFVTAAELLGDLQSTDSPLLRRRKLAKYTYPALLCLDEVGYLSFDDNAADLLYSVLNPRYEASRSTLVTTNLAFKDWTAVFPNATSIVTLVDRITHHADITVIQGDSYRTHESTLEASARAAQRRDSRP